MPEIRFTLLSDGSSDRRLLPVLRWALHRTGFRGTIQDAWADLGRLRHAPRGLAERISATVHFYSPIDILFIHRDAESQNHVEREQEIETAVGAARRGVNPIPRTIQVVPVRMQEAWLLFNEDAIRRASGNPNGRVSLNLPPIASLESVPDPKGLLHTLLLEASERTGRRKRKLRPEYLANRVVEFIDDYSPIEALPAFQRLLSDVDQVLMSEGWHG